MYDHDLRLWYRDLFLRTARPRRRARAADPSAASGAARLGQATASDAGLPRADAEWLSDHERPQATH